MSFTGVKVGFTKFEFLSLWSRTYPYLPVLTRGLEVRSVDYWKVDYWTLLINSARISAKIEIIGENILFTHDLLSIIKLNFINILALNNDHQQYWGDFMSMHV